MINVKCFRSSAMVIYNRVVCRHVRDILRSTYSVQDHLFVCCFLFVGFVLFSWICLWGDGFMQKSLFVFVVFSYWVVLFYFIIFCCSCCCSLCCFLFVCVGGFGVFFNVLRFRYIRKNMISTNCSDIRSGMSIF